MSQPLFFTNPQIVSLERHGGARVPSNLGLGFARRTGYVPLTLSDIPEAAKSYPIVFLAADVTGPVAMLGLESVNYFIDEKNEWSTRDYIPAYVRQYPFVFQQTSANAADSELMLSADEPAVDFTGESDGSALYEDGKVSPFTQKAFEFCTAFHREYQATRRLCEDFVRLGLVMSRQIDTRLGNERTIKLTDIGAIDEAKFKALPAQDILHLHQQGSLGLLYYILQSQSNWRRLLDLAQAHEAIAA